MKFKQLKKMKAYLEKLELLGKITSEQKELLDELRLIAELDTNGLFESAAVASSSCSACGRAY